MTLLAAIGQAQELDGREAGLQATHHALNQLGNATPILGIVVSSHKYDAQQVVSGVTSLIGNTPLIGFSAPAGFTAAGLHSHSVVIGIVGGDEVQAHVHWLAGYTQGSREVSQQLAKILDQDLSLPALLFADGFNADAEQLCATLPPSAVVVGALSCGDLHTGNAYQIGGNQVGAGGLATALLAGKIRLGIGYDHGWQPIGVHFRVTRSRGFWLRTLDGRPASETYAHLFGYPARDWAFPPLNHMARLYALGLEQYGENLLVRSPLRVEADGSFRMNATVNDGSEVYLLVGSLTTCREAAQRAAQQALLALNGARPILALVLADVAWQMLFEAQAGADVTAVREILGSDVPILGGYTLGQIVPGVDSAPPQFLNQHMVLVVLGEPVEQ